MASLDIDTGIDIGFSSWEDSRGNSRLWAAPVGKLLAVHVWALDSGLEGGFSVRVSITLRLGKEKGVKRKVKYNWHAKLASKGKERNVGGLSAWSEDEKGRDWMERQPERKEHQPAQFPY
jgi:hypothetical protein